MQASRELSIFLTLALGVAIGKVKIKGFSLGSVTGVLLMRVLVGQLDLVIYLGSRHCAADELKGDGDLVNLYRPFIKND